MAIHPPRARLVCRLSGGVRLRAGSGCIPAHMCSPIRSPWCGWLDEVRKHPRPAQATPPDEPCETTHPTGRRATYRPQVTNDFALPQLAKPLQELPVLTARIVCMTTTIGPDLDARSPLAAVVRADRVAA